MVGKIWEDKWEYENFTYFVGDPLLKLGTSELGNIGINPNLGRYRIDSWLNNAGTRLDEDHMVASEL